MAVKTFWLKNSGQVIADVDDNLDGSFTATNPVLLIPTPGGLQTIPLLAVCEEKEMKFGKEDMLFAGNFFNPIKEMRNQYSENYGSGIQLLS